MTVTFNPPVSTTSRSVFVVKRSGEHAAISPEQITEAVNECADGLRVNTTVIVDETIRGLVTNITTQELNRLSVVAAANRSIFHPDYSVLAARLELRWLGRGIRKAGINSFDESVRLGFLEGLISEQTWRFVAEHAGVLNGAIDLDRDRYFDYPAVSTLVDRYLLRQRESRTVFEHPGWMFMRVACGLAETPDEAIRMYDLMSTRQYLPSTPTLFNSGTTHSQMSSCYLLDSPEDSLDGLFDSFGKVAQLSKHSGGIGIPFSKVRARGSLIRSTNGHSNGVVPFATILDATIGAVNQGGKRKGAACMYLESWHADIEEFLDLRNETGHRSSRVFNMNIANWVPDLFMKRVLSGEMWSLFDPAKVSWLVDLYGREFEDAYVAAEQAGVAERQVSALALYEKMMRTLASTGNGWMVFKDASNLKSNQTGSGNYTVHSSNLCTEIMEVTDGANIAVCNLGSLNLASFVVDGQVDYERLGEVSRFALRMLDRVIDVNFYPAPEAGVSNRKWRPVGLGVMGFAEMLASLGFAFGSPEAQQVNRKVFETIYAYALLESTYLAERHGVHPSFSETRAAAGKLQPDLWGVETTLPVWAEIRDRVSTYGLRNSLLVAVAPTATIATICGVTEGIEPFDRHARSTKTLSGEYPILNRALVAAIERDGGVWTETYAKRLIEDEGSVQQLGISETLRVLFLTRYEMSMRDVIDMAATRGPFIDQSQSLNLWTSAPKIDSLAAMYMHAWKQGLKSTYYLTGVAANRVGTMKHSEVSEAEQCAIDNPGACEACQ